MIRKLVIVILGLGMLTGPGQGRAQGPKAAQPKTPAPDKVVRLVYPVLNENVNELAKVLDGHFRNGNFQVTPLAASGYLLISGPSSDVEEIQKLLQLIDRPSQMVLVEVLIAEVADGAAEKNIERKGPPEGPTAGKLDLSGPWEGVMKKVQELRRRGTLGSVKTIRLTTLENQTGLVQSMENKPHVMGRTRSSGGISSSMITYKSVGTALTVTPQVLRDGKISLKLKVEDARMNVPRIGVKGGGGDKDESLPRAEFITSTLETKLVITPGQAAGTEEVNTNAKSGKQRTIILVTARVVPALVKDKYKDEEKKASGFRK